MATKPKIAFICEASLQIGSGHVIRCLTLANELGSRGYDIIFLCTAETVQTVSALRDGPYKISDGKKIERADWLVIDHYALDNVFEKDARTWAGNILVIDDLADRMHDCDVLVDMTYGRQKDDYLALTPGNCLILTGSEYALLRKEFLDRAQSTQRDFKNAGTILVSFGGVNPKSATEYTLTMLSGYLDHSLDIHVVAGAAAKGLSEIRNLVEKANVQGPHTITLHVDTPHISTIMEQCHLCIGAGGTTSWERCCLGLPTLAIELADNQSKILKELDAVGALKNMGPIEDLDTISFHAAFSKIIEDKSSLQTMSVNAQKICDGKGTARVVEAMLCE